MENAGNDVVDHSLLERLLQEGESEYVDFKQECYHKEKKVDFLHDILCLANANSPNNRYMIFGVSDNRQIIGMSSDVCLNNIIDWLRNAHLNKSLYNYISLHPVHCNEKRVIILQIKNVPFKPFALTKDYKCGKSILRAGVIYTRNRDSNTPINSTASDDEISLMWRERFGLDNTPHEKAYELLKDYNNWKYEGATNSFFYSKDPEYKIKNKESKQDSEYILKTFKPYLSEYLTDIDPSKISIEVYTVEYKKTEIGIDAVVISGLDNGRRLIPYPYSDSNNENNASKYYIKNNYELDMCQILQRYCFWSEEACGDRSVNDYYVTSTITRFTKFPIEDDDSTDRYC